MAQINIGSNIGAIIAQFTSFQTLLTGGVRKAILSVGTALKALALNPIGAILTAVAVAVAAITAALSKFQPAIDLAQQAFASINAVIDVFVDRLQNIGNVFIQLFSGELSFSDAIDELSNSFSGLGEEIRREAAAASELELATQRLMDREIELLTVQAELRAESREALLLAADQNLSIEDRIEALGEAEVAIRQSLANERELAEERARILREQQALGNNTRDDNRELAELEAQLINLRAEEATQLKEISGVRSGLQKMQQAQIDANTKLAEQEADRVRELEQGREIELLEARGATEEELYEARLERAETEAEREQLMHDETIRLIEEEVQARKDAAEQEVEDAKKAADDKMRIEEEEVAAKMEATDAIIGAGAAIGDALTTLAGDNKGLAIAGLIVEQAAGVAGIVVDTVRASARALADLGPIAGPIAAGGIIAGGAAGVASAIAATVKGIAAINSAPGPSASGSAGSGGASSVSFGPVASTPRTGSVAGDGASGIELPVENGVTTGPPIMAVVAQGDLENSRERAARSKRLRTFGG